MSGATDVLALQATTRDYMRTARMQNYCRNMVDEFSHVFGDVAQVTSELHALREIARLTEAESFHVHHEAMPLVLWAAKQLPDDAAWDRPLAPARRGFLVLSETLVLDALGIGVGVMSNVRALSWEIGIQHGRPGVFVTYYAAIASEMRQAISRADALLADMQRLDAEGAPIDQSQRDRIQQLHAKAHDLTHWRSFGELVPSLADFISWGEDLHPAPDHLPTVPRRDVMANGWGGDSDWSTRMLASRNAGRRVLMALWTLLGQTIVAPVVEPMSPGQVRAWAKKRVPPRVTVIRMRRVEGVDRRSDESAVEWSHRWVVKGHWRRQPHGPGRTQTHLTWIAPYVKGPADKPLYVSQKVYSLVQ